MWNNIKKLILFLFGIVLVVFGNRAAINTIFGSDQKEKEDNQGTTEPDIKEPVIEEDIEPENASDVSGKSDEPVKGLEQISGDKKNPDKKADVSSVPVSETKQKSVDNQVKNTPTTKEQPKKEEKAEQPAKAQDEKKEKVAEETNKTIIEPEKSEEATGTE